MSRRRLSVMTVIALIFGVFFPVAPALALTCAQRDALIASALSSGDIAAAASYRNMPCSSGSAPTLTCAQRNLNIANALSRGDLASAAFWQGAACVGSSSGGSTSGSSGGSTAGSSGGTSGGPAGGAPAGAAPACTGAPSSPTLSSQYTRTGIRVTVTPSPSSQMIVDLQYSYTIWDSASRSWGAWTPWTSLSGSSATTIEINPPSSTSTKIGFSAVARNSCAISPASRLDPDRKGVLIFNPQRDTISQSVSALVTGQRVLLTDVFRSASGTFEGIRVLTPRTCSVSEGGLMARATGTCTVEVTTATVGDVLGATQTFSIRVSQPVRTITCVKNSNRNVRLQVSGAQPICPKGYRRG